MNPQVGFYLLVVAGGIVGAGFCSWQLVSVLRGGVITRKWGMKPATRTTTPWVYWYFVTVVFLGIVIAVWGAAGCIARILAKFQ
jgi:hypothetical protein